MKKVSRRRLLMMVEAPFEGVSWEDTYLFGVVRLSVHRGAWTENQLLQFFSHEVMKYPTGHWSTPIVRTRLITVAGSLRNVSGMSPWVQDRHWRPWSGYWLVKHLGSSLVGWQQSWWPHDNSVTPRTWQDDHMTITWHQEHEHHTCSS